MSDLLKAVVAYKAIDHYVTSADARLAYRSDSEHLDYLRRRDSELAQANELSETRAIEEAYRDRRFAEEQARLDRMHQEQESEAERMHQAQMQANEHKMRSIELMAQMKLGKMALDQQKELGILNAQTLMRNSDLDREAQLNMQAKQLDQNEQLEIRRLRVQQKLADQNEALQKYLFEQGVRSTQELERFKALATRETQILLARENAQNMLQNHMVQEALKTFPLNISPIVLLQNKPHSLTGLLRFSSQLDKTVLPSISQVYNDVKAYAKNPEALNVFIAPIYLDSKIQNREQLSQQIWDSIYQKVESFFTENYNRRGEHPVILYPTAWKDSSAAGQHASETLHFFLKDIPCLVLEPRFDGQSFSLMLSTWGLGYSSTDHVRTEMNFDLNIDAVLIESAYNRSKKSLKILDELGESVNQVLADKRSQLEQNVKYYEMLNLSERIKQGTMEEINAIGVYNLFHIDPVQDMADATKQISELICMNLAILADIHHLQSTDTAPLFPTLFKQNFENLFSDFPLREIVAKCYERVYILLRKDDASAVEMSHKREVERVRELQITNLNKSLQLIDEQAAVNEIENKLRKYASDRFGINAENIDDLWKQSIEHMEVNDIPFFKEILVNIEDRRLYKQIDKRILDLQRI